MRNATIRVQTLDGGWETVGIDRMAGIVAENIKYSADAGGSSSASFDLKRDPAVVWPDIAAFAPVELEVDGVLVWSGRVKETPTRESATETVINVQCEGWQFHLDDDVFTKTYVRTRLSDWQDCRSFPTTDLTYYTSSMYVNSDNGKITIGNQDGNNWVTVKFVGIGLDLGPNALAKRIIVKGYRTAGTGGSTLYIRGASDPAGWSSGVSYSDAVSAYSIGSISTTAPAGSVFAGTFSTPYRYVSIFLYLPGATYTSASPDGNGDVFIITDIQVFTDTLYESGNASILKASDVIADTLGACPNLSSTDTSGITATSFSIPDFSVVDPQTPRSVQDAVNAFHNYRRYVDVNRRLIFKAQSSAAIIEAAAGSVVSVEDASANSGDDIYNKVVLTGTQANGSPLYVTRYSGGSSTTYTGGSSTSTLTIPLAGTFQAHHTYTVTFSIMRSSNLSSPPGGTVDFGTATDFEELIFARFTSGATYTTSMTWTPTATYSSGVQLVASGTSGTTVHNVTLSNISVSGGGSTLVDYRGFNRAKVLPLSFPTTSAAATQLGDTFLSSHLRTPFKGTVQAKGSNSLLRITTGEPVPVHLMPLYAGELLRLPDRIDPDTGALGRDGKMAQVDVDLNEDSATIALDNTRNDFEAFLARLEVVTNRRVQ